MSKPVHVMMTVVISVGYVVHVFDGMNTFNYQLVHVSQHVPTIHKLDRLRYKNYFTFST